MQTKLGLLGFALSPFWFTLGPRVFLDTKMLVSATQAARVGGRSQHEALT